MKIDYPSDQEIQGQIQTILDQSLPKRKTFYSYLKEMHHQLGWKYIFRDYQELILIGALFILYIVAFGLHLYQMEENQLMINRLYGYLFVSSPLLYGAISVFSFIGKQETFEIEMICKYNVYQVSAYRMLVFSVASILVNIFQIGLASLTLQNFNPMMGMMISLSSLFIFALGFLSLTTHNHSKTRQILIIGGWVAINLAIAILSATLHQQVLVNIPSIVYTIVIVSAGYFYLKKIRNLVFERGLSSC